MRINASSVMDRINASNFNTEVPGPLPQLMPFAGNTGTGPSILNIDVNINPPTDSGVRRIVAKLPQINIGSPRSH